MWQQRYKYNSCIVLHCEICGLFADSCHLHLSANLEAANVWHIPIYIFMKIEFGHASVSKATIMFCLDKCSNLCVIFLINPFICKWLRLAPRCKLWGPECWMKVCYLLCGLLISFVSVVPDCVTAECCDCLSLSAASAVTPHF